MRSLNILKRIKYDDYMKNICKRYKLKCMRLDIHNKNIKKIDTIDRLYDNVNKPANQPNILGETGLIGPIGQTESGDPCYYFNCPVINDHCIVCV